MSSDQVLRQQLLALLRGGNAHMTFDQALAGFPVKHINTRPFQVPYTPWHLLEHLRIAQWDILEFVRNPGHISPDWPEGYWPAQDTQATPRQWEEALVTFRADLQAVMEIVKNPETDFFNPLPHALGYTIFREVLLVADHNAYHVGEFAILRQVMGTW